MKQIIELIIIPHLLTLFVCSNSQPIFIRGTRGDYIIVPSGDPSSEPIYYEFNPNKIQESSKNPSKSLKFQRKTGFQIDYSSLEQTTSNEVSGPSLPSLLNIITKNLNSTAKQIQPPPLYEEVIEIVRETRNNKNSRNGRNLKLPTAPLLTSRSKRSSIEEANANENEIEYYDPEEYSVEYIDYEDVDSASGSFTIERESIEKPYSSNKARSLRLPLEHKPSQSKPVQNFNSFDPEVQKLQNEIYKGLEKWKSNQNTKYAQTDLAASGLTKAITLIEMI